MKRTQRRVKKNQRRVKKTQRRVKRTQRRVKRTQKRYKKRIKKTNKKGGEWYHKMIDRKDVNCYIADIFKKFKDRYGEKKKPVLPYFTKYTDIYSIYNLIKYSKKYRSYLGIDEKEWVKKYEGKLYNEISKLGNKIIFEQSKGIFSLNMIKIVTYDNTPDMSESLEIFDRNIKKLKSWIVNLEVEIKKAKKQEKVLLESKQKDKAKIMANNYKLKEILMKNFKKQMEYARLQSAALREKDVKIKKQEEDVKSSDLLRSSTDLMEQWLENRCGFMGLLRSNSKEIPNSFEEHVSGNIKESKIINIPIEEINDPTQAENEPTQAGKNLPILYK